MSYDHSLSHWERTSFLRRNAALIPNDKSKAQTCDIDMLLINYSEDI